MTATLYTHLGYRAETGRAHRGKLYGHGSYAGRVHALTGPEHVREMAMYTAVCGKAVRCEYDPHIYGDVLTVWPVQESQRPTCKRCRKILESQGGQS